MLVRQQADETARLGYYFNVELLQHGNTYIQSCWSICVANNCTSIPGLPTWFEGPTRLNTIGLFTSKEKLCDCHNRFSSACHLIRRIYLAAAVRKRLDACKPAKYHQSLSALMALSPCCVCHRQGVIVFDFVGGPPEFCGGPPVFWGGRTCILWGSTCVLWGGHLCLVWGHLCLAGGPACVLWGASCVLWGVPLCLVGGPPVSCGGSTYVL